MMEGKVVKVMSDEEWANLSPESRHNLNTLFAYNQFPAPKPGNFNVEFDEREVKIIEEAMVAKGMSATALLRHFVRLGQFIDYWMQKENQGYQLKFQHKNTGEIVDPFYDGPKMAPFSIQGAAPIDPSLCVHIPQKDGHIDCPCWTTGVYKRVEGCKHHPYDL